MLKGKTKSGFEFQIDEKIMDDMELLDLIATAEEEPHKFPKVLTKVLGEEQKQKLYEHVRTKKGNVPIEKAMNAFVEIMNTAGDGTKNS